MLSVGIKNLELFGYIGLYPEEKKVPNKIRFQIEVCINEANTFVDYTWLSALAAQSLEQGFQLLEEVLHWIRGEILKRHNEATVQITIEKCTPPTGTACESSYVKWSG